MSIAPTMMLECAAQLGFKSTTASDARPARAKNHDTCNRECQRAATQRDEWQRGHHHCSDPLSGREAGVADIPAIGPMRHTSCSKYGSIAISPVCRELLPWQKTPDGGVYLFGLRVHLYFRSLELFDFGGSILVAAAQFDDVRNTVVHRPTSLHTPR